MLLLLQGFDKLLFGAFIFTIAHVVNGGHGADENFTRSEGTDDADAHFPVEAERGDKWLDGAAHFSREAVAEFCAGFFFIEFGKLKVGSPAFRRLRNARARAACRRNS